MLALLEVPLPCWAGFVGTVIFFLSLDLSVFHRRAHVVRFREALVWTILWFTLAMFFATMVAPQMVPAFGRQETVEFIIGYITELSLSMDNVFVIAVIFRYFGVPSQYQHRVLFWGILGALIMRGVMIGTGVVLLARFHWMLYMFGVFLIVTGVKMIVAPEEEVRPEGNPVTRLARRWFRVSAEFDGQRFITKQAGRRLLTPLALVLLMIESTDLVFALDSIPAIFGVTDNAFVIFTSNVFAILGLRSLYFVLANAIDYFQYLKVGLSFILVFIGVKMLIAPWFKISANQSLIVVASTMLVSIIASVVAARLEKRRGRPPGEAQ